MFRISTYQFSPVIYNRVKSTSSYHRQTAFKLLNNTKQEIIKPQPYINAYSTSSSHNGKVVTSEAAIDEYFVDRKNEVLDIGNQS